ncbi:MAG: cytochrome c biogenesis protein CcdA, partial [Thermoguttaceae bacterium]
MRNRNFPVRILGGLIGASMCLVAAVWAQPPDLGLPLGGGQDGTGFQLGPSEGALGEGDRVPKLDAGFTAPGSDHSAQLFISATLPPGSHTYSITQPSGGPRPTTIKINPSTDMHVIGEVRSVVPPQIEHDEDAFPGLRLETHSGTVKWVATIQFAPGVRPETIKIQGNANMQLCDAKGCVQPKDYPFTAALRPDVRAVTVVEPKPIETPSTAPPIVAPLPIVRPPSNPATKPPVPANGSAPAARNPAKPAETAKPRAARGNGEINWLPFTNASELGQMVGPSFDLEQIRENVRKDGVSMGIVSAIFAGFFGGLIFNIMPCVLPVIGLKILSFVEQAGHNRRKAFMLNIWYSLGLLLVFFIFASLAVGPQHLGWGELFGKAWFTITLSAVVFVMALSFMGVWEVPLPSFLGGGKAGELAAQEGAVGAFFKGVLTTFLATPCGAPIFAPALVWATAQPAWLTYSIFLSAGLGMASPYLLVGTFPELLRFLPKPGAWMETFKQFMGFVLMGTVVYLLAVIKPQYVVPTVGLLFSLSFLCWWVGR